MRRPAFRSDKPRVGGCLWVYGWPVGYYPFWGKETRERGLERERESFFKSCAHFLPSTSPFRRRRPAITKTAAAAAAAAARPPPVVPFLGLIHIRLLDCPVLSPARARHHGADLDNCDYIRRDSSNGPAGYVTAQGPPPARPLADASSKRSPSPSPPPPPPPSSLLTACL